MQIQIISSIKSASPRIVIYEKSGTSPVRHTTAPGEHINLRIDGVPIEGNNKVGGQLLRIKRVNASLFIEDETGEGLVQLLGFYNAEDAMLGGSSWNLGGLEHLVQTPEGLISYTAEYIDTGASSPTLSDPTIFAMAVVGTAALASSDQARIASSNAADTNSSGSAKMAALIKISKYAEDSSNAVPTLSDYAAAGVTGLVAEKLASVNTAVDATNALGADTQAEVQALVDAAMAAKVPASTTESAGPIVQKTTPTDEVASSGDHIDESTYVAASGVENVLTLGVPSGDYTGALIVSTGDKNDTVYALEPSLIAKVSLGEGDDTLINGLKSQADFSLAGASYDGGPGVDTYAHASTYKEGSTALETSAHYDYTLREAPGLSVSGFEIFSMAAETPHVVDLSLDNILDFTRGNKVANTLRIVGDANDVLNLKTLGSVASTPAAGTQIEDVDGALTLVSSSVSGSNASNDVAIDAKTYDVYQFQQGMYSFNLLVSTDIKTNVI